MQTTSTDPGSRAAVWTAAAVSALLIAQQVSGRAARDALFLTSFSVSTLPVMMVAAAVGSILAVLAWSYLLARRSPQVIMPWAAALSAVFLVGEFAVSAASPPLAALLVYLHLAIFGPTLVSGFWSVVSERFDPYRARVAVGRIGAGASLGGIAGGLVALAASRLWPASAMLLIMAVLMFAAAVGLYRLAGPRSATATPKAEAAPTAFAILRKVSYLRLVGTLVALGALIETVLDYVLKAEAASSLNSESSLLAFFAILNTAQSVLAFAVQTSLTSSSLGLLGISGTVAVRPALTLVLSIVGLLDPRMWSAAVARLAHEVGSNSLFRSGYELLYTPLPEAEKRPRKAIVDVGMDKVGAALGGAIVWGVATALPTSSLRIFFGLGVVLSLAAVALTGRLHRGYVRTLEGSLRAGRVRLDPEDVADEATRITLAQTSLALDREKLLQDIAAYRAHTAATDAGDGGDELLKAVADLRSGQIERVRSTVRGIPQPEPALVAHLIPLLGRDDLFLEILRPLRRVAATATGQLADALLDHRQDGVVRRRVARALKGCGTARAVEALLQGLDDSSLDVRAECALSLLATTTRHPALRPPVEVVFASALRELERAETSASSEILQQVFSLLSLVLDPEPLRMAWWALRAGDSRLRGTALEYLDNVLPDALRRALWPHLGERAPAARTLRPRQALVEDLMRSSDSLDLRRELLGLRRRSG